jgi:hydroxymethylbilane synthase
VRPLRIGARRSALATVQAEQVRALLFGQGVEAEIVGITTSGDEGADASSSPSGLKGLWIDAILDALRNGEIDLAVHSAKDLPAEEDDDLVIGAVPPRGDPHDVLVLRDERELAAGMVVGTSSVRRRAQIQALVPGVGVADLRGNVETRLKKLTNGDVDAAVLAAAGLERLGLQPAHARWLEVHEMLPAPGQGCLAVQCRSDARDVAAVLVLLDDHAARAALETERALMRRIGGGCALPLGAIAAVKTDTIRLAACVASPDGVRLVKAAAQATAPERAASLVAQELEAKGARAILAEVGGA